MKKKIYMVVTVLILASMLIILTGCGEKSENTNTENINNENIQANVNNNKALNETETATGKLTIENFKKIMNEKGLEVQQNTPDGVNSAVYNYSVNDTTAIRYEFEDYKNEEIAKSKWNENLKGIEDNYTDRQVIKEEKNGDTHKLEFTRPDYGTLIEFKEGKNILSVVILESADAEAVARAKDILENLGFTPTSF